MSDSSPRPLPTSAQIAFPITGGQASDFIGRQVAGMIRRSVKSRFRAVYLNTSSEPLPEKCIFVPNHHGWHDGYVMFHVLGALQRPFLDWITEFDAFPLFAKVGGMPFPADDATRRAKTIRETIRRMNNEGRSLLLFAESHLHRGPQLLPFGKALELIANKVPEAAIIPVAIRYDMSLHERPECFVSIGNPVPRSVSLEAAADPDFPNRTAPVAELPLADRTRLAVRELLDQTNAKINHDPDAFGLLVAGTLDVNERMDMRRFKKVR